MSYSANELDLGATVQLCHRCHRLYKTGVLQGNSLFRTRLLCNPVGNIVMSMRHDRVLTKWLGWGTTSGPEPVEGSDWFSPDAHKAASIQHKTQKPTWLIHDNLFHLVTNSHKPPEQTLLIHNELFHLVQTLRVIFLIHRHHHSEQK